MNTFYEWIMAILCLLGAATFGFGMLVAWWHRRLSNWLYLVVAANLLMANAMCLGALLTSMQLFGQRIPYLEGPLGGVLFFAILLLGSFLMTIATTALLIDIKRQFARWKEVTESSGSSGVSKN